MLQSGLPTMALGRASAGHALPDKLGALADAGIEAVEIFYECLAAHATQCAGSTEADRLRTAAAEIGALCRSLGLAVPVLQPFLHSEGLLDRAEAMRRREEFKLWLDLASLVGTDLILVPSNFQRTGVSSDLDLIAADVRALADLAAAHSPPIRICYEAIAWGTVINRWQQSWDIVQRVDRPNCGLIVDGFHICAYEQADPARLSFERADGRQRLAASLDELVRTVPASRLFFVQLGDGERLRGPLDASHRLHDEKMLPLMSWSRSCRVYPHEATGFLNQQAVFDAIFRMGYSGAVSFEIFNADQYDRRADLPQLMAARAMTSWTRLVAAQTRSPVPPTPTADKVQLLDIVVPSSRAPLMAANL